MSLQLQISGILTLCVLQTIISISLAYGSAGGNRRLWIVAGAIMLIMSIIGLRVSEIPLYTNYCVPLCNSGFGMFPFPMVIAVFVGACIHSIPWLQTRRWLQFSLGFVLMGLILLVFGLYFWFTL